MFSSGILSDDARDIELEIERKCLVLGIDVANAHQVQRFAHDLLQNIDTLRNAASSGDRVADSKVELYGLSVLMHKTYSESLGAGYLAQFDELAKQQKAWAIVARAIWRELEERNPE